MSLVGRQFNIHRNFGPYVVRSTISDELHKIAIEKQKKEEEASKVKIKEQ